MRIAIVNDMKMTVEMLRRIVQSVSTHELAWVAYDGKEAVEKCAADRPDLILMDLIMPVMDGALATKEIMQKTPCAILIVTATVSGNAPIVFQAMGCGALDVVRTPVMDPHTSTVDSKDLLTKIDRIAILIGKSSKITTRQKKVTKPVDLLLVGASTGGPMALVQLLSHLVTPPIFAGVLIQHVDEQFSEGLARWLSSETKQNVKIAQEGDSPQGGVFLLAGKNDHLYMDKEGCLGYTQDPIENPYRPSVDVFYQSVAQNWSAKGAAVLLTGMGGDGAKGMKVLRDLGWHTIAQDEASSIVFGMPKAAIAIGGATEILPLQQIAPAVTKFFEKRI